MHAARTAAVTAAGKAAALATSAQFCSCSAEIGFYMQVLGCRACSAQLLREQQAAAGRQAWQW
jgi:hypothetical protein